MRRVPVRPRQGGLLGPQNARYTPHSCRALRRRGLRHGAIVQQLRAVTPLLIEHRTTRRGSWSALPCNATPTAAGVDDVGQPARPPEPPEGAAMERFVNI